MSLNLVNFVRTFLKGTSDCELFCNDYTNYWKMERDSGELLQDDLSTSEALASIFCLVDLFNPVSNREEYELDEKSLRFEISRVLGLI